MDGDEKQTGYLFVIILVAALVIVILNIIYFVNHVHAF